MTIYRIANSSNETMALFMSNPFTDEATARTALKAFCDAHMLAGGLAELKPRLQISSWRDVK